MGAVSVGDDLPVAECNSTCGGGSSRGRRLRQQRCCGLGAVRCGREGGVPERDAIGAAARALWGGNQWDERGSL